MESAPVSKRLLRLVVIVSGCALVATGFVISEASGGKPRLVLTSADDQDHEAQIDKCADCHRGRDAAVLDLYVDSVHSREKLTCNRCHGGDPFTGEKDKAHSGRFVGGLPTPMETIAMCGSCHRAQTAMFRTGRHFPEGRRAPRVDCSQCHGAHTIGSPRRNFSMALYCTGCHGLEYLPELPEPFRDMLRLVDDLNDLSARASTEKRNLPRAAAAERKELSRRIAEIVHTTDLDGGRERIPAILETGNRIKELFSKPRQ